MGGLLFWYSEEGPARAGVPPSPLLAVANVTTHQSTASLPGPCENGSAETTVAEGGRNLVAGLWGHTLGEN